MNIDTILADLLGDELLDAALPLPPRAPSLADIACYEAEAIHVSHLQAVVIARAAATVAPKRAS